jgi:hypothetical protein
MQKRMNAENQLEFVHSDNENQQSNLSLDESRQKMVEIDRSNDSSPILKAKKGAISLKNRRDKLSKRPELEHIRHI